ncbi:TPA: hypothetical protein RZN50_000118 [Citrobacter braakii]|uniref:Uncharacterized protein n=1 Tax=Kluyvera ascorbata TaxID=51288 RepID=A0A3N2S4U3_9ENTR|nr:MULTISPECIES: hypothetical protein [Enterobacteriaceae]HEC1249249.1 hypothetical protein [Citrobacter braakii]MDM2889079.1 hypothetical protein [Citrobacter sp. Cpo045]MDM2924385.1 hypothetical protein [Citrobacter sp. Cpa228]ROU14733.1 hypothetical protein EB837_09685 [Kluyvera ascorbata]WFW91919.1 hypothetical protein NFJ87_00400 [Citrobacter freundii]
MAKKKDDGSAVMLLFVVAFFVFLPFLIFGIFFYRKLKRKYSAIPNIQRVYDIGVLFKTLGASIVVIVVSAVLVLQFCGLLAKNLSPETSRNIAGVILVLYPIVMIWPMKKMAERIAIEYFGIIFNDNDRTMILPADIGNMGLGDRLRLKFLSRMGEQDSIEIRKISNITREKGVNFYIHGDFGSRRINFSNKQKRDECISALQARTRVKGGRDYGY